LLRVKLDFEKFGVAQSEEETFAYLRQIKRQNIEGEKILLDYYNTEAGK
jgi:hypothetical protein